MLRTSHSMADIAQYSHGLSDRLCRLMAQFLRFSSFYGSYQSLPPSERRRFVINQQK